MRVLLTFDYELFFGKETGTVEKCMLEPTNFLLQFSERYKVPMTFFVDVGYLVQLQKYSVEFPQLKRDYDRVLAQIQRMEELGCSVQLHIHPHWYRSTYDGSKWNILINGNYRLADFSKEEITEIVTTYTHYLRSIVNGKVNTYRAGGWCIQPFQNIRDIFFELGITQDTSVFPGGKFQSEHYQFDFTSVPRFSDAYRFEEDVCIENMQGSFTEFPIASWRYSPLFYWSLYIRGRLNPLDHKMIGDGNFVAQPGRKWEVLTNFTWNHVSCDGFYAGKLTQQASVYQRKKVAHFVVIGHPKGLTNYALKQLERFIVTTQNKYEFHSFQTL